MARFKMLENGGHANFSAVDKPVASFGLKRHQLLDRREGKLIWQAVISWQGRARM